MPPPKAVLLLLVEPLELAAAVAAGLIAILDMSYLAFAFA
jgi:hypothetical protein